MKTPIQELIEHFTDAWASPSDLWKPSKVIDKIESMLEKEKEVITDAYWEGGQSVPSHIHTVDDWYNRTFNTNDK